MGRFVFRLEPVLQMREMHEQAAQQELARVEQDRLAAEQRLAGTRRKLRETLRDHPSPSIDVLSHQHLEYYRDALARQQSVQEVELRKRSSVVEQKRDDLMRAMQEKRVLERLREKQEHAYRSRESARLTGELDEAGLMTFRFQKTVKGGE